MTTSITRDSSLDIFSTSLVQRDYESRNVLRIFPITTLEGPTLEFEFKTARNVFVELDNIKLKLGVKIVKNGNDDLEDGTDDEVLFANNVMHSIFSNAEIQYNNEQVYTSNGLFAHKCFIETEMSTTVGAKEVLAAQGYTYEQEPNDRTKSAFVSRKALTKKSTVLWLQGDIGCEVFKTDQLLLPNVAVRIRLVRASPHFCLLGPDDTNPSGYNFKITSATLLVPERTVNVNVSNQMLAVHQRRAAQYKYHELKAKTFVVPANNLHFYMENVFNNMPIRRLAIAMNTSAACTGTLKTNPFHYQTFGLQRILITRGAQTLYDVSTNDNNVEMYKTTMNALKFLNDGPGIALSSYPNHYILVFDMSANQMPHTEMHYEELIGGEIRLELFFAKALPNATEIIILGEVLTTITISTDGRVVKSDG